MNNHTLEAVVEEKDLGLCVKTYYKRYKNKVKS